MKDYTQPLPDEEESLRTVLGFLLGNEEEIIKDLTKEFGPRIVKLNESKNRYKMMFERHINESMRHRVREMFSGFACLNSEQAFILESHDLVKEVIDQLMARMLR